MTKLQIVETAHNDLGDIIGLLIDLPFGPGTSAIDQDWLSGLCGKDWGLWRTAMDVLARVASFGSELGSLPGRYPLGSQLEILTACLETSPKTLGWKARAAIGRRIQWYERKRPSGATRLTV